ncbi:MAG: TetR family transcriptional regulator, partial [Variovorax sp.]|nr:TetR family transcriptional regulator [Variovorax sp.]
WRKRIAGKADNAAALNALVDGYLSAQSRNSAGTSCPTSGFAIDVAREPADKPIHAAYVEGLKRQIDILLSIQEGGDAGADRSHALAQMATMVGAMVLARATRGDPLSNELMAAARDHLRASP